MNFRLLGSLPQPLTMRRSSWEARSGSWFSAVRVVQRLHPSPEALTEVLESRGASDVVIKCAREYKCVACARYKKPDGVAPSALPRAKEFNEQLQADIFGSRSTTTRCLCLTLWTKPPSTKLQRSFQLSELTTFNKPMERIWIRHFGCPKVLVTDEGRGWNADRFHDWTSDQMIEHQVAPGEAHTRLSLVERRHAVLRKAAEVWMEDQKMVSVDGPQSSPLCYVVPQLNACTNSLWFFSCAMALWISTSFCR